MMSIKATGAIAISALVVGLIIALIVVTGGRRDVRFRADSLEAVNSKQDSLLGLAYKRASQAEIERDKFSKALRTKPRVIIRTDVVFRPIEGDSVPGTGVREVEGDRIDSLILRDAPVTLKLEAALPAPPAKGRFSYKLGIDPLTIIPRVECSTEKYDGIRRAFVAFDSLPEWASIKIREAQTDRSVCNPSTAGFGFSMKIPAWATGLGMAGSFVVGFFLGSK